MLITSSFNRFIHGVVLSEMHKLRYLKINEHGMAIRPFYLTLNTLKKLLKYLDFEYPRTKGQEPLSYTKLREYDFLKHIAFIETLMAENGYTANYIERFKEGKQENV